MVPKDQILKKKLAILGASYLQKPLVQKAKDMGLETHVFAWREGNVVENISDFYYDISILEKEEILKICASVVIDGIISVASDAAMPTVNYVANKLDLVGNSIWCTEVTTDKFKMRESLSAGDISIPKYFLVTESNSHNVDFSIELPLIVKPVDRSGSRGVALVHEMEELRSALDKSIAESFSSKAIVEEFIDGQEFSVEAVSIKGVHTILAITEKTTTGAPHFVELAHKQPAQISPEQKQKIEDVTLRSLDCLQVQNGMSHTELKLDKNDKPLIIEVAARMGGDFIGSILTTESTGIDTVRLVIKIALGSDISDELQEFNSNHKSVGVMFNYRESELLRLKTNGFVILRTEEIINTSVCSNPLVSSSDRFNYCIYAGDN
jgi:biotin carboxylase